MKKLLFTIIILGACLVGSSQNWDSVRVGNLDVDSIMLGGAKIWEKPIVTPSTGVFTMTTTSTRSSWTPSQVTNSGETLHWEVTGAATASANEDQPTFDFSTSGEKFLTVTSSDNLAGVEYIALYENQLTSFDATGLTGLQELYLFDNQLTSFDATGLTGLQKLDIDNNQLTSFDATGLTGLQKLYLGNNQLTSFDATGLTGLQELGLSDNQLTSLSINNILDYLIANTIGTSLKATNQRGGGCGDPAKITALDAIWDEVYVDACP